MKFDLVIRCSTALERQVRETIHLKMKMEQGIKILNSKIEYNRFLLPALMVAGPVENDEKEKRNESKEEDKEETRIPDGERVISLMCRDEDKKRRKDEDFEIEKDPSEVKKKERTRKKRRITRRKGESKEEIKNLGS